MEGLLLLQLLVELLDLCPSWAVLDFRPKTNTKEPKIAKRRSNPGQIGVQNAWECLGNFQATNMLYDAPSSQTLKP